jgi:hypothetical protein
LHEQSTSSAFEIASIFVTKGTLIDDNFAEIDVYARAIKKKQKNKKITC